MTWATSITELAEWFKEGVQKELEYLESNSGSQKYELLSGELSGRLSDAEQVFHFMVADETRIPEDSTGNLKVGDVEYIVKVIGQIGTKITIIINTDYEFGNTIPRAILEIDDTVLVKILLERLTEISNGEVELSNFSHRVFNPLNENCGRLEIPDGKILDILRSEDQSESRLAIEQSIGSPVTYIWGPPGTGKTYTISYLIGVLLSLGKRIMVTSHTNAAIDQIIFEATKDNETLPGPLAEYVNNGYQELIVRLGQTIGNRVPACVCLDEIVKGKSAELLNSLNDLEKKLADHTKTVATLQKTLAECEKLATARKLLENKHSKAISLNRSKEALKSETMNLKAKIKMLSDDYKKAENAWFFKERKKERIIVESKQIKKDLVTKEEIIKEIEANLGDLFEIIREIKRAIGRAEEKLHYMPPKEEIKDELQKNENMIKALNESISEIQSKLSQIQSEVIDNAKVLFCTLTKNYASQELNSQEFDVVIIDEISMALPPLIFLASGKAKSNVILVGDFIQLPPIVRSDSEICAQRLGKDAFSLSGLVDERTIRLKDDVECVVKLRTQRRMASPIAEIARNYAYREANINLQDHHEVTERSLGICMENMPNDEIVIVDTADLNCWCGKQPVGLSRFNFYSAIIAVEIAAMFSKYMPLPGVNVSQPIGIVTPFAAQKKIITRLTKDLQLERWVNVGTVHTFQGGEADLIIFDSVLDNPYWSAMMVTPKHFYRVKRELNVALTRAKSKFIFLGSSSWLNAHSRINSGLGLFWEMLKEKAPLISATVLTDTNLLSKCLYSKHSIEAWSVPESNLGELLIPLDEETFFDYFTDDIRDSKKTIFALAPYFGNYRWPRVQPFFQDAIQRGVEVTIVIPPLQEAENQVYVEEVVKNLRSIGAIVFYSSGLHGKDVIIDNKILYTGSMNWSSNRGLNETSHRIVSEDYASLCLDLLQVKYIRQAGFDTSEEGRKCPICGSAVHIVNLRKQNGPWDKQPLKVGCTNSECSGYLRDINERPPFKNIPVCERDNVTKYRKVPYRRSTYWKCPKHPSDCQAYKAVPGDAE